MLQNLRLHTIVPRVGNSGTESKSPSTITELRILAQVQTAIQELEPAYKEVLVLRDIEGLARPT